MPRKMSEWDRHCRRFHALNRAYGAVMRQVIKVYGKEPDTEAFLRQIAGQIKTELHIENTNRPAVSA